VSRIYVVFERDTKEKFFVRANTLNGAMRAVTNEHYAGRTATTDELYQAFKLGLTVIDAVAPEQLDIYGGAENE
jgi:hypothetical protein